MNPSKQSKPDQILKNLQLMKPWIWAQWRNLLWANLKISILKTYQSKKINKQKNKN
jgi:hypothetical protein